VLVPDEKDEGETQFYAMGGLINRGGLLIGLVKVLRDEVHNDPNDPSAHGIGDTTLAYTRDGIHWTRDREPFIPRNPKVGTFDHAMTWGDCQLIVGDELFIYYGGYMHGHKTNRFVERQIGLARMPLDRYVARSAGAQRATLLTKQLMLNGKLTLNAKIDGSLQVRLIDSHGNTLDKEYPPLRLSGDSLSHAIKWPRINRTVRIGFQMSHAKLYGFALTD
jgi:hypothetical protein